MKMTSSLSGITALGIATVFGTVGEGIFNIAAIVSIYAESNSPMSMSYLMVFMTIPAILLAPFQGAIFDRFDLKRTAVGSSLARTLIALSLACTSYFFDKNINLLYLGILIYYTLWYFMVPLSETLITQVVERNSYGKGMSILQGSWQAGALSSAIIAGTLISLTSFTVTFIVVGILDLLSAYGYFKIKTLVPSPVPVNKNESPPETSKKLASFVEDIASGVSFALGKRQVALVLLISALAHPFYQSINTLLAPFNAEVLNGNSFTLGLIDGMAGVGSLASAFLCVYLARNSKWFFTFFLGSQLLLIITVTLFSNTVSVWLAAALYVLIGLFSGNLKIIAKTILLEVTDSKYIGRVMSLSSIVSLFIGVGIALLTGALATYSLKMGYTVSVVLIASSFVLSFFAIKQERNTIPILSNKGK